MRLRHLLPFLAAAPSMVMTTSLFDKTSLTLQRFQNPPEKYSAATYKFHSDNKHPFIQYNGNKMAEVASTRYRDRDKDPNIPVSYLKQAYEWEKTESEDKVILYHGETYGLWLLQLLQKQREFPHAEDWLPLRFDRKNSEVNAKDLMKLHALVSTDHDSSFQRNALAAHWNLVEDFSAEHPWGFVYSVHVGGVFGGISWSSTDIMSRVRFEMGLTSHAEFQLNAVADFIYRRRNIEQPRSSQREYDYGSLFPSLSSEELEIVTSEKIDEQRKQELEGVILQLVMDKKHANRQCYMAFPFGAPYSISNEKFTYEAKFENGDEIEDFSEIYQKLKNKDIVKALGMQLLNRHSARVALDKHFRTYPSAVKIRALSPLEEDAVAMNLVKKMINDVVSGLNKK